jgi:hypothetical protein
MYHPLIKGVKSVQRASKHALKSSLEVTFWDNMSLPAKELQPGDLVLVENLNSRMHEGRIGAVYSSNGMKCQLLTSNHLSPGSTSEFKICRKKNAHGIILHGYAAPSVTQVGIVYCLT